MQTGNSGRFDCGIYQRRDAFVQ